MVKSIDIDSLIQKSKWLRNSLFDMAYPIKKGHVPSCFSMVEILVALYYTGMLTLNPKDPRWIERDRVIISKGHGAMALYPILADLGYFSKEELNKFTKREGILRQYADSSISGIECACGSLGHGLGIGAGYAIAAKQDKRKSKTYVIISDGEYYEGSVTESARIAAQYELENLICIIDRNQLMILGRTEQFMKIEPMEEQWKSLGWHVERINGHSYKEILEAFDRIEKKTDNKPSVIIADTVKGKGIPQIEQDLYVKDDMYWHNKFPKTDEQFQSFKKALEANYIFE